MEYGKIVNRSVNIVWDNKFLIVLGILVALGGGTSTLNGSGGGNGGGGGGGTTGQVPGLSGGEALAIGLIIGVILVAILIGLVLWAIGTVARGGLIAGVDTLEEGGKSSFSQAWSAGWQKVWTLLGIGILPAIPGLAVFVFGVFAAIIGLIGYSTGLGDLMSDPMSQGIDTGVAVLAALVVCIVLPISLVLAILRNFAERAAMLENLGVIDSYRRGASVLTANLGEAILLFLLQIGIFLVLAILLIVPGIIVTLCCFLWPLFIVAQGAASAFVSSLWTLAWRTWTIGTPPAAKMPKAI